MVICGICGCFGNIIEITRDNRYVILKFQCNGNRDHNNTWKILHNNEE